MHAERDDRASAVLLANALLVCSLAVVATSADTVARAQAPAVVRVDGGELQGVLDDGVVSFKGIPFAAPPVGDLRWRSPQPAAKWTGVRQAAEFGATACKAGSDRLPPQVGPRRVSRRRIVCS
jgi:para-nitrobenzyl esterase